MLVAAVVVPTAMWLVIGESETPQAVGTPAVAIAAPAPEPVRLPPPPPPPPPEPATIPDADNVATAKAWVKKRGGNISFATIDSEGEIHGFRPNLQYSSASTVKAMLLVAELRRLAAEAKPGNQKRFAEPDPATAAQLELMIRWSDNETSDAIYARSGDEGLESVAADAGMTNYEVNGHWGNSQITAADMARLMAKIPALMPPRYRDYGMDLLGTVTPEQSWGVPKVARPDDWRVWFKGGWLPESSMGTIAHQAARLTRDGQLVSISVLTAGNPSHAYGVETIEGVTRRLLPRD